jgi:hypothetical protein
MIANINHNNLHQQREVPEWIYWMQLKQKKDKEGTKNPIVLIHSPSLKHNLE